MASPAPGDLLIQAMYDTALDGMRRGDAEQVYEALEPAMAPAVFDQLSPGRKLEVAEIFGQAAQEMHEWDKAHAAFVRATTDRAASPEDWDGRMHTAILSGDGRDAYLAFRHLRDAGRSPLSTFAGAEIDRLDQLLRELPEPEARLALGREMQAEAWSQPYPYADPSNLWLHYVEALQAVGDAKGAALAAARITDPMVMMAMHADRRFDAVIAATPSLQDPAAAAERYLAWARARAFEQPRMLGAQITVARALSILGRDEEALPILDAASRAVATASRASPPYDDMGERRALEAWRASVLLTIGRTDEGLGLRAGVADCHCSPADATTLARELMRAGRGAEATRWLAEAPIAGLGLHEQMERSEVAACAAAQIHDDPGLARELAFLAGHEAWLPEAHVRALVCANRLDDAQAVILRQIADPRTRLSALASLQTYFPDVHEGPFQHELTDRWASLAARPPVQAEVAKVGRIKRYALRQWESVS